MLTDPGKGPHTAEHHAHMQMRQKQNQEQCKRSKAEAWMADKLKATYSHWTRQAQFGYRIVDFWNHEKGIAIEVDGPEHRRERDKESDIRMRGVRGIVVLRVKNWNEADAQAAIDFFMTAIGWQERRAHLNLPTF